MSYASVNGLQMYYEIHGSGKPLVLLHGNLSTIEVDFAGIIPRLSQGRQVIGVEQQAHGHTADVDRPLTLRAWAEDTAQLLRQLDITGADVLGYSSGSGVAVHLALDHPELADRLVLLSPAYRRDGLHAGVLEGIEGLQPEHLAGTPFERAYARVAPRPQDWPLLIEKIKKMDASLDEWSAETIAGLDRPALLIFGDSDIIRPEHAVEMFRLYGGGVAGDVAGLPRSRLAILPGTTHVTLVGRADWLASMVEEFLDV